MPLNERKIISIILEECKNIEVRCEGYQKEIQDLVADIVVAERQNMEPGQRTYIQKKVCDACNASGRFLSDKAVNKKTPEENSE